MLIDPIEPLWIDGHKTYNGLNDKIPVSHSIGVTSSLRLVGVEKMTFQVFKPGEAFGNTKRRVQGCFRHSGSEYWLWVTDPGYERTYLAKPDGTYEIGESLITVSLGEPLDDACYKLIAAIIEKHTVAST